MTSYRESISEITPEFEDESRYTTSGRKWVDAITEDFPYADGTDKMCGTCSFMLKQDETDIVGICMNDNLKINGGESK